MSSMEICTGALTFNMDYQVITLLKYQSVSALAADIRINEFLSIDKRILIYA